MIAPIQIRWHSSQIHPFPILEIFGVVNSSIRLSQSMYLQLAIPMINMVESYGRVVSEPMGQVPVDPNIFFTVYFKSQDSLKDFLDGMGANRMR